MGFLPDVVRAWRLVISTLIALAVLAVLGATVPMTGGEFLASSLLVAVLVWLTPTLMVRAWPRVRSALYIHGRRDGGDG